MASSASLLAKTEAAIEALLDAIADPNVQEYQVGNRRVRRAEFSTTLDALNRQRAVYRKEVNRATGRSVRVAKLGRSRAVKR